MDDTELYELNLEENECYTAYQEEIEELRTMLKEAHCPVCDSPGKIEGLCKWCDKRYELLRERS